MEKEFVSYTLALRLKALGFDEPCLGYYAGDILCTGQPQEIHLDEDGNYKKSKTESFPIIAAPLFSQAFRWFREKYNLICRVSVTSYGCTLDEQEFYCVITSKYGTASYEIFNTYEEAELDCLKKLIEIVEQK